MGYYTKLGGLSALYTLGMRPEVEEAFLKDKDALIKQLREEGPIPESFDLEGKGRRLGLMAGLPLTALQGGFAGYNLGKAQLNPPGYRLAPALRGGALTLGALLTPKILADTGASIGRRIEDAQ